MMDTTIQHTNTTIQHTNTTIQHTTIEHTNTTIQHTNTTMEPNDSYSTNHQILGNEWKGMEEKLGDNGEITSMMASSTSNIVNNTIDILNEQISFPKTFPEGYCEIRNNPELLEKSGLLETKLEYVSILPKKMNKTETMKLNITKGKYADELKKITTGDADLEDPTVFKSIGDGFIEFKFLGLIMHLNRLMGSKKSSSKKSSSKKSVTNTKKSVINTKKSSLKKTDEELEEERYEAFIGIGKLISMIESVKVIHHTIKGEPIQVPQVILNDLSFKYTEFCESISFDYSCAAKKYPSLFYTTKYDKILPGMSHKLYESQARMLEFVKDNFNNPFVCVFNTLMGMGKTWIAGYIGYQVYLTNIKFSTVRGFRPKTFIYTCPEILKSVREIVGRISYLQHVPFAVAFIEAGKLKIKEHNNCKGGKKPTIILAGVQATIELLKSTYVQKIKRKDICGNVHEEVLWSIEPQNNILFYDENTVGLDNEQSQMASYLSEIYRHLPSQSIFSSATHPDIEHLDSLREYATSKFGEDIVFETINYSKVLIGTQLNRMNSEMVIPHAQCNTRDVLRRFIDEVANDRMKKKFYTLSLVIKMHEKLIALSVKIPTHLDFRNWMDCLDHRNQESIQNLGIEYLELIYQLSESRTDVIELFNNITYTNVQINYNDLVATSLVLDGQTFISCRDPQSELLAKFSGHFARVMERLHVRSFDEFYSKYKKIMEEQEKKAKSSQKAKSSTSEKISKLDRLIDQLQDASQVSIPEIPSDLKLGKNKVSMPINITDWDGIIADDQLKLAALMGIFIYSERTHRTYHNFVMDKIRNNCAVYVFADSTLNYGNSFPFNNGIILSSMASHSSNTLLQLMARAGRPGISHSAIIYADDAVLTKVLSAIYDETLPDYELMNLNRAIEMAQQREIHEVELLHEREIAEVIAREVRELREARELEAKTLREAREAEARTVREAEHAEHAEQAEHAEHAEQARLRSEQEALLNSRWRRSGTPAQPLPLPLPLPQALPQYQTQPQTQSNGNRTWGSTNDRTEQNSNSNSNNWSRSQRVPKF